MEYLKFIGSLYFLLGAFLGHGQTDLKCTFLKDVAIGPFSYSSFHTEDNYFVAQQKVGNYLQIFRINADQSLQQLTFDSVNHMHATISKNGGWIAFTKETGTDTDIYLMHSTSHEQQNVTNTPDFDEAHPLWSVDDSLILFNTNRYDSLQEIGAVWLHDKSTIRITFNKDEDTYGSLSPDRKKVVFTKWLNDDKNPETYVLSLEDGIEMRMTYNELRDVAPRWISENVISYTQSGSVILHDIESNVQRRLTTDTEFLYGRGVPLSLHSILCEKIKDRRSHGLAILYF